MQFRNLGLENTDTFIHFDDNTMYFIDSVFGFETEVLSQFMLAFKVNDSLVYEKHCTLKFDMPVKKEFDKSYIWNAIIVFEMRN